MQIAEPEAPRILVIRRDNIGDLVCTIPALQVLRARFPRARLAALVTSYNVATIAHHAALDVVYSYTKPKHARHAAALSYFQRLRILWRIRCERFDFAVLAGSTFQPRTARLARWLGAGCIVGYASPGDSRSRWIDVQLPCPHAPLHEAEAVFRLLQPFGIDGPPPAAQIVPDSAEVNAARDRLRMHGAGSSRVIGVHISTRKASNRWPDEKYIELIRRLWVVHDAIFLLLWAPGDAANPRHPGDDASAAKIKDALANVPVAAYPMGPLSQLIADISLCDSVITSDGGAMHVAAGLGKPILCFFGDTDATHWRPWAVSHELLQPPSRRAADISVDEAVGAFERLARATGFPARRQDGAGAAGS